MKTRKNFSELHFPSWLGMICMAILSLMSISVNATTVTINATSSGVVTPAFAVTSGAMTNLISAAGNRGWATFAIPALPAGAVVTDVSAVFTTTNATGTIQSTLLNNLYAIPGNAAAMTGSQLYSACGGAPGPLLIRHPWALNATETEPLLCDGLDFIQNHLNSTISIGYVRDALGQAAATYAINAFNSATPPKIIITYITGITCSSSTSTTTTSTDCNTHTWAGPASLDTYYASGVYCQKGINAQGCLQTSYLNLTIVYDSYNGVPTNLMQPNTVVTACGSYHWNNATYTTSGTYTFTSLNSTGCLNTDILNLTIIPVNSFTNPIVIGQAPCLSAPYVNTQTNTTANCFVNNIAGSGNSSPDIWYKFTLAKPSTIRISTCGSGLNDTYLSLFGSIGTTNVLAVNDFQGPICTAASEFEHASIISPLPAGTYYILAEGWASYTGSITTTVSTSFMDCYCSSAAAYDDDEEIYKVTLNGSSTNPTYVNGCNNPVAPGYGSILNRYSNFNHPSIGSLTTIWPSQNVPFTIEENECDGPTYYAFGTAIWIDYNRDGDFDDPGERVFFENTTATGPRNVSNAFTVPNNVTCGPTVMRVMVAEGVAGAGLTPCLQYGWGETEDHLINIGTAPVTTTQIIDCSYTWPCNGVTYTLSGVYTCTHLDANGCISTDILNLTIVQGIQTTTNVSYCGNSYTWEGTTYTLSGTYTHTYAPCNTHTLILTLHPNPTVNAIGNSPMSCGDQGFISIYSSGGTPFPYNAYMVGMNPGYPPSLSSTAFSIGGLNAGAYVITVSDANMCTATSIVTLAPPHPAALHFDGINDNVTVPNNSSLSFGMGNFTLEAWARFDNAQTPGVNNPTILSKRSLTGTPFKGFRLLMQSGKLYVEMNGSLHGPYTPAGVSNMYDNNCYHIAVTRNWNTFSVYINNSLRGIFTQSGTGGFPINVTSTGLLTFGMDYLSQSNTHMKGAIDEVRLWNYARSLNDMMASSYCVIQAQNNLVAYYRFDEGIPNMPNPTVTTAFDRSNNAHNGTLNNFLKSGTQSNYVPYCVPCCPQLNIANVTSCYSYTWPATGATYTASGVYATATDTLNLTILQSTTSSSTVAFTNVYTWANTGATYTASGSYTTTLQNSQGCDSIATLNLTITPGAFSLNVIVDQTVSCYGLSDGAIQATAAAGGNYTYVITNPTMPSVTNTTGFFDYLEPGQHTVCATNNNAPYGTVCAIIQMDQPDPLSIFFSTDSLPTCAGSNGVLSAIVTGGTNNIQPYLTYWYDSSNTLLNPTGYFDQSISGVSAGTYKLVIEDDHYCLDTTTIDVVGGSCGTTLDLHLFIQGYWDGMSGMVPVLANQGEVTTATACDTITVELHDANAPYGMLYTTQAVLQQDGNASCVFASGVTPDNYYIAVKHRNAIETWSANPVTYTGPSNPLNYDWAVSPSQAYGNNEVSVAPGIWAFYSGDIIVDENIDLLDMGAMETDINNFQYGYLSTDLNGDGNVDLLDTPFLEDNINNFIFSAHP